ncbi:hypothetical protein N431DRAFT_473709 [Stipitochalara longipes BDJ]|nr:hypothetical protein N431DRAFT_473709 [Stipitochalara longipes BDJ]
MKFTKFCSTLLVPAIALGSLIPGAVPGSEIAGGSLGSRLVRRGCTANNCARAVTGTAAKPALTARQSDCSSFMLQSVVLPTTTITVTEAANKRRQETIVPSIVPTYASACANPSAYSSACSCWGITATTVTAQPTATSIITTLSGILEINSGGSSLGYVATDPNYYTPIITSDPTQALVVTFVVPHGATSVSNVDFATSANNEGYPFLGLIQGRDNPDATEAPGSSNYLYIGPVDYTAPGSTPQDGGSYYDVKTGLNHDAESSVWNVDIATGLVTPTWINPDGTPALDVQFFVQSEHVYAGSDPGAFYARYPAPVTDVTINFIAS